MKISEVSEQCGVSADTLRYYERIGLLPPVNRSESGIRDYNELDVRRVGFIKCMRTAGLPVEVLITYYQLVQQGEETIAWPTNRSDACACGWMRSTCFTNTAPIRMCPCKIWLELSRI